MARQILSAEDFAARVAAHVGAGLPEDDARAVVGEEYEVGEVLQGVPEVPAVAPVAAAPAAVGDDAGICPEVRDAMPNMARRTYQDAERLADASGRFEYGSRQAARRLRTHPRTVKKAITLHKAAGVWKITNAGRRHTSQAPGRPTRYRLVRDFKRAVAVAAYRAARAARPGYRGPTPPGDGGPL